MENSLGSPDVRNNSGKHSSASDNLTSDNTCQNPSIIQTTATPTKHQHQHHNDKSVLQNQNNFPPGNGQNSLSLNSNDLGYKSTENDCNPNTEGSKQASPKFSNKDGSESETSQKSGQHKRSSNSASNSPFSSPSFSSSSTLQTMTASSPLTSTPSNEELPSMFPESCSLSLSSSSASNDHNHHQGGTAPDASSSPSIDGRITLQPLMDVDVSYSSPRFCSRVANAHASGESSDEKQDKIERMHLSTSREPSFERSVSFQEGVLDQDKNEALKTYDSIHSLDSSRLLDSTSLSLTSSGKERDRKESRDGKSNEKDKKSRKAWYNVLNPTYKSRSEDLKRLFRELPSDERLIVDYSCALQKDILVHGRLYVTPNYFCFYSKIFGWETFLCIKCKDIVAMTKEKTALVIPNALQMNTETEKHFFTSFATRDKTYLMLFRIWQNALMDQQVSTTELWQWVHSSYGEELGLTSDDDDYISPSTDDCMKNSFSMPLESGIESLNTKLMKHNSVDSAEDVSQGDSNVEDGSQRLPSLYEVNTPSDVTKNITNKSPSKTPSPQLHYYPHSPPPPPQVNGESPQPQELKELLTDISDINESDHEIEKPTGPFTEIVVCPNISTHHQGREVINIVYALPIDILFTLLFTNSKFMLDLHTTRKTYDVVHSPWQSNPETNQKIRQVTYTLTLPTNSFGPKVSHVTETQVIASFSKPCELYTVDAEACNSGIPYADSFFVSNHWCLTREANNETRLAVWSEVKYKKNVWGFMKNVIDKNAFSGMEGLMSDLNASLMEEVDRTNQKRTRRRRRRAGSKTIDVTDPLLQIPIPGDKIKDIHKSTQMPSRKLHIPSVSMEVPCSPLKTSVRTAALLFLCILLAVNAFLYYRLYALEERVVNGVTSRNLGFDSSIFKVAGRDDEIPVEEWVQILHQQESLHSAEVERWRKAVSEAAEYLKKAEESLRGLHASIPNSQASKMQALLQHLQLLQQMQEKRFATKFESKAAKNDDNKIDLEMESEEEWQKTNSKQPEEL